MTKQFAIIELLVKGQCLEANLKIVLGTNVTKLIFITAENSADKTETSALTPSAALLQSLLSAYAQNEPTAHNRTLQTDKKSLH